MSYDIFLHTDWNNMLEAREVIYHWANRTFPARVPESSLIKLVMEEIPELLTHRKEKGLKEIGEEMADCFILLLDLSRIWRVDLESALRSKMLKNANRTWVHDESTGFYNHIEGSHDETRGSSKVAPGVRHQTMDNSPSVPGTDCCGASIQSVGSSNVLVRSSRGWHTSQLVRKGGSWVLGACTRCGRDLDGGLAVANQVLNRRNLAGDLEETEGTGVG